MTTATRVPRPTGSGNSQAAPSRDWLSEVSRSIQSRPSTVIFYGPPGIGKTSLAASIPGVAFLVERQEMGIQPLKESGLVPAELPVLPVADNWIDTLEILDSLRTGKHEFKALAIDALGGFERLCHEEVCRRDYENKMNEKGFLSYKAGYETSLADWRLFINALDRLRDERKMSIVLLGHSKVSPFKNPEGPDYDRYSVDIHPKTWGLTHKWADMVLFANFDVAFASGDDTKKKAKARGGKTRSIYTENDAAFDAKNRHNLAPVISMGDSGQEAWGNLVSAIREGRKTTQQQGA